MTYQTEEEQVARLKELWQEHGKPLLTGVVLALAGVFGWQGWNNYQEGQAANASALYQSMLETALSREDEAGRTEAVALAEQLREAFPRSHYARFAALMQARMAVEAEDFSGAESLLREVVEGAGDAALEEVARQRLARVLAEQGRHEEGLALFTGSVSGELLAGREEVRGDLLLALGRNADARSAYQAALAALDDPRARPQLQFKLDDLAEEA